MPSSTLDEAAKALHPELESVFNQPDTSQSWTSWISSSLTGTEDHTARPPPLPEGTMPKISIADFHRYISNIGQKLDQASAISSHAHRDEQHTPTNSNTSDAVLSRRRRSTDNNYSSSSYGLAQAMTEVPLLYFQEDFSVDWSELWAHLGDIDTSEKQQRVLDTLTAHLDSIEMHLTHEIGARYESFFEASVYIHELKNDINALLDQVSDRRRIMDEIVEETHIEALTAHQMGRKKENLAATLQLAMAAQQVIQAKSALQSSLQIAPHAGLDYIGTLGILTGLQETYNMHGSTDIAAISALPEYIDGVTKAMKEIMISDVLEHTKFNSQMHIDALLVGSRANNGNDGNGNGDTTNSDSESAAMLMNIEPPLTGLCQIGNIFDAIHALHKELYLDMSSHLTTLTGRYLDEICGVCDVDITDGLSGISMTKSLKAIDGYQFTALFRLTVSATTSFINHCQLINKCIDRILDSVTEKMPSISKNIPDRRSLDCCQRAVQGAVGCWAGLMGAWTESTALGNFSLAHLCSVLEVTDVFASAIEVYAGKSIGTLRGYIQDACRATLDHMHSQHLNALTESLEQEKWSYIPIGKESQSIIDELESVSQRQQTSPIRHATASTIKNKLHTGSDIPMNIRNTTARNDNDSDEQSLLYINGKGFHTIHTVQVLLSILKQYHAFCTAIPALTADASQRVIELLRTFNSRTCQLILGAGAMQVSGLKSISVKHLAIACHSIRAAVALNPALQSLFVHPVLPLPRRNFIGDEYARTLQDMTTHIDEICNKIVTVLCERLRVVPDLRAMLGPHHAPSSTATAAITTAATTTAESQGSMAMMPAPSAFATSIAKQLHILSDIMSSTSLREDTNSVLKAVAQRFSTVLTSAYGNERLEGAGLDGQLAVDLNFLVESMEKLPLDAVLVQGYIGEMKVLHMKYRARSKQEGEERKGFVGSDKSAHSMGNHASTSDGNNNNDDDDNNIDDIAGADIHSSPPSPPSPPPQQIQHAEEEEEEEEEQSFSNSQGEVEKLVVGIAEVDDKTNFIDDPVSVDGHSQPVHGDINVGDDTDDGFDEIDIKGDE